MEQRALGRSGLVVSRIGLGTMTWGRETDEDEAAMQLTAFVDAGGTLVDTADVYCEGEGERTLGRLLADVVPRGDVLVATKAVGRTGPGPMGRGASRGHLLAALDASLATELWCSGRHAYAVLAEACRDGDWHATVRYDQAPYGVQYTVASWQRTDTTAPAAT